MRSLGSAGNTKLEPRGWNPEGIDEVENEFQRAWSIVKNRFWVIAGIPTVVTVAVAIGTFRQTPIYRASATVEIRRQAAEAVPVETLFESGRVSPQYLETQYEILQSASLARETIRALDLTRYSEFYTPPEAQVAPVVPEDPVEVALPKFQSRLLVDPIRDSRLVNLNFDSEHPEIAARVVSGIVDTYIDMRVDAGRAAVERLERQADSVRTKLLEAELGLNAFMAENDLSFSDTDTPRDTESANLAERRLQRFEEQLTEAAVDRFATESRYKASRESEFESVNSQVVEDLTRRIAELTAEYARLQSIFTDESRTRDVKQQLDALTGLLERERERIATELKSDFDAAIQQQSMLRQAVGSQRDSIARLRTKVAEYRILEYEVKGHRDFYLSLQQKKKEAEVAAAMASTEIALVAEPAIPQDPIIPSPKRNIPLGAIVGLMLGLGVAMLLEYANATVRTSDEMRAMSQVPILAMIPAAGPQSGTGIRALPSRLKSAIGPREKPAFGGAGGKRITIDDGAGGILAEAFGTLRTALLLNRDGSTPHVLQTTSPHPGDGKTTVSVNLAISLSRLGSRVLLIDADCRVPSVHKTLKVSRDVGLSDYLRGHNDWRECVQANVRPDLDVLTAGPSMLSPSEFLSSASMERLLDEARENYDFVLVDTPAVLINMPDTKIVASLADGVVMVVRSGSAKQAVARALNEMSSFVTGVVLNNVDADHFPPYYRDYPSEIEVPVGPRKTGRTSGHNATPLGLVYSQRRSSMRRPASSDHV